MLEVGSDVVRVHATGKSPTFWTEKFWLHARAVLLNLKGKSKVKAEEDIDTSLRNKDPMVKS